MIDQAIEEGNLLLKTTTLQEKPDHVWLQDWMLRTQRFVVDKQIGIVV